LTRLRRPLVRILDLLLATAALTSSAVLASALVATPATANNLTWDIRHLGRMHSAYSDEDFCLETTNTSRNWSTMNNNVANALWVEPAPANEWDAKGWDPVAGRYKVWFSGHFAPCQQLSQAERDPITIEYWMFDNNTANCGAQTCSIAFGDTPYIDIKNHDAFVYYYIDLYAPYTAGEVIAGYYRHQVNHETGHALGFDHGAGCPPSVMHEPGCVHEPFPTAGDISSENTRIEN
jgi:hypothetical protein